MDCCNIRETPLQVTFDTQHRVWSGLLAFPESCAYHTTRTSYRRRIHCLPRIHALSPAQSEQYPSFNLSITVTPTIAEWRNNLRHYHHHILHPFRDLPQQQTAVHHNGLVNNNRNSITHRRLQPLRSTLQRNSIWPVSRSTGQEGTRRRKNGTRRICRRDWLSMLLVLVPLVGWSRR